MTTPITQDRCIALFQKPPPPIRVRVIWFGLTNADGRLNAEGHGQAAGSLPMVTVSGTKRILDGSPVERTSAMRPEK